VFVKVAEFMILPFRLYRISKSVKFAITRCLKLGKIKLTHLVLFTVPEYIFLEYPLTFGKIREMPVSGQFTNAFYMRLGHIIDFNSVKFAKTNNILGIYRMIKNRITKKAKVAFMHAASKSIINVSDMRRLGARLDWRIISSRKLPDMLIIHFHRNIVWSIFLNQNYRNYFGVDATEIIVNYAAKLAKTTRVILPAYIQMHRRSPSTLVYTNSILEFHELCRHFDIDEIFIGHSCSESLAERGINVPISQVSMFNKPKTDTLSRVELFRALNELNELSNPIDWSISKYGIELRLFKAIQKFKLPINGHFDEKLMGVIEEAYYRNPAIAIDCTILVVENRLFSNSIIEANFELLYPSYRCG